MKILTIIIKDLTSSFRSAFLLIFMFGIPLLVTGLFAMMFNGNPDESSIGFEKTNLAIINLDQGNPQILFYLQQQTDFNHSSLGEMIISALSEKELLSSINIFQPTDREAGQEMLTNGAVDVLVILPADLSSQYAHPQGHSTIEIIYTQDKILHGQIIKHTLSAVTEELSKTHIAVNMIFSQPSDLQNTPDMIQNVLNQNRKTSEISSNLTSELILQNDKPENSIVLDMVTQIMSGMMVFFAFFTGTTCAQSILQEAEKGTLARMFTTPTYQSKIFAGKLLYVFLIVTVQVVVLISASNLIFKIDWGTPLAVLFTIVGIVIPASTFGIFANTLAKNTRQGGIIFGGLLTVTGMIGMMDIFSAGNPDSGLRNISLVVPQGWSIKIVHASMAGEAFSSMLLTLGILLLWGLVFLMLGLPNFIKRFK